MSNYQRPEKVPTFVEITCYAKWLGMDLDRVKAWFEINQKHAWRNPHRNTIKNWKRDLLEWQMSYDHEYCPLPPSNPDCEERQLTRGEWLSETHREWIDKIQMLYEEVYKIKIILERGEITADTEAK